MDKKNIKWNLIYQYGYLVTNIVNAFLLLPLYVKHINEIQLGLWWATGNVLAWLMMSDPGIGDVLQQRIAVLFGQKDNQGVGYLIGSGLMASFFSFLISILIGFVFFILIDTIIPIDKHIDYSNLKNAFVISIFATGFTLISFALAGINQGLLRSKIVAFAYITANLLFLAVNIVFLFWGWGLLSIAIANLCRAAYLLLFNLYFVFFSNSNKTNIIFSWTHFKSFVRIFSYTSVAKIITSFSTNFDLIILARFVSPQLITLFEINRRPAKILQGFIGRYSVALMPSISSALGVDRVLVEKRILKSFDFYLLITFFATGLLFVSYQGLISIWISPEKFAGLMFTILLLLNFMFAGLGYFMSNMLYAIGDIKVNSIVNLVKGLLLLLLIPVAAYLLGINGVLLVVLMTTVMIDFIYFTRRLLSLGFLKVKADELMRWCVLLIIAVCALLLSNLVAFFISTHGLLMLLFSKIVVFFCVFCMGILLFNKYYLTLFRSK